MNKKALRAVINLASGDAQNRYEARHEILSALARKWGLNQLADRLQELAGKPLRSEHERAVEH